MPARFKVRITRAAEMDIQAIWSFIAADSSANADRFILEMEKQLNALEHFPQRCPLIPENEHLGTQYRHLLYGDYRTLFRIAGKTVYVVRVIHGARLLDDSFLENRE
jgi:plasmid stabilization system protein ParE